MPDHHFVMPDLIGHLALSVMPDLIGHLSFLRHARLDRASLAVTGKRLPVEAGNDEEGPAMTKRGRQ